MIRNLANQTLLLFAFTKSTSAPKTGLTDIVGAQKIDAGSITDLTNGATEVSTSKATGYYTIPLTQAETNGDVIFFWGRTDDGTVSVIACPPRIETIPSRPVTTEPQTAATLMEASATTGGTYDFFAYDTSSPRQVWNGTSFEAMNPLSYAQYRITATEQATQQSGRYYGTAPSNTAYFELRARGSNMATSTIVATGSFVTGAGDALEASVQKVLKVAIAKDD